MFWPVGEPEYCLKYLNVCVRFTPDLWPHRGDGGCMRRRRRRKRRRATDSVCLFIVRFRVMVVTAHNINMVKPALKKVIDSIPGGRKAKSDLLSVQQGRVFFLYFCSF